MKPKCVTLQVWCMCMPSGVCRVLFTVLSLMSSFSKLCNSLEHAVLIFIHSSCATLRPCTTGGKTKGVLLQNTIWLPLSYVFKDSWCSCCRACLSVQADVYSSAQPAALICITCWAVELCLCRIIPYYTWQAAVLWGILNGHTAEWGYYCKIWGETSNNFGKSFEQYGRKIQLFHLLIGSFYYSDPLVCNW